MKDTIQVMNSHVKGGKTLFISRNDQGEQGVDFIADIPPFIGNEKWADLFSAAPELLKLLKDCHNVLFQFPDYQEGNLCDDVKAAINKSEGKL